MSSNNTNPYEQAARMGTPTPASPDTSSSRMDIPIRPDAETSAGTDRNVHPAEEATPSTNGAAEGRDEKGRFTAGNKGGPGNPFAREVARIRKRLLARLTNEDIDAITDKLIEQAKAGDVAAAKLLFSYTMGKPAAGVDPDHLDVKEWEQFKTTSRMMQEMIPVLMSMTSGAVLHVVRNGLPLMSDLNAKKLANILEHPETVLPKMPDLVMAREKAPKEEAAGMGQCVPPPEHPRGSEYLASGLGEDGVRLPVSAAQRRAWGLNQPRFGTPSTKDVHGQKKARKKGKRPSTKDAHGRLHAQASGAPSRNGVAA